MKHNAVLKQPYHLLLDLLIERLIMASYTGPEVDNNLHTTLKVTGQVTFHFILISSQNNVP